jgi:hypothetical protein
VAGHAIELLGVKDIHTSIDRDSLASIAFHFSEPLCGCMLVKSRLGWRIG